MIESIVTKVALKVIKEEDDDGIVEENGIDRTDSVIEADVSIRIEDFIKKVLNYMKGVGMPTIKAENTIRIRAITVND